MSEINRTQLDNKVFVHAKENGNIIISRKYEGPLRQDRFEEIELSTVGAQALLDFLINGEAVEHSVQSNGLHSCLCGDRIPLDEYRCSNCREWETARR